MSIGYMDDTLIVAEGAIVNDEQEWMNSALYVVSYHNCGLSLCLAIDKTQAVVFTRWRGQMTSLIILEGKKHLARTVSELSRHHAWKHGGVVWVHMRVTPAKAQCVTSVLFRLILNVPWTKWGQERLFAGVVQLYCFTVLWNRCLPISTFGMSAFCRKFISGWL